ncbi:hypothetical protein PybrP1_000330, partial [[Pythium] brassicae (nom. inval.)]
ATVAVIEQKRVGYHSMKIESELQSIAHLIMKNSGAPLYKAGFVETTALVLARQTKIWMRDRALLLGKLVEATLITQGKDFIWIGILVLIAYYVGFTLLNTAVLRFIHYEFQSTASSSAKAVEGTYSAEDKARGDNSVRELSVVTPVPTAEMATATATASKDVVVQVPTAAQLEEGQSATFVS